MNKILSPILLSGCVHERNVGTGNPVGKVQENTILLRRNLIRPDHINLITFNRPCVCIFDNFDVVGRAAEELHTSGRRRLPGSTLYTCIIHFIKAGLSTLIQTRLGS